MVFSASEEMQVINFGRCPVTISRFVPEMLVSVTFSIDCLASHEPLSATELPMTRRHCLFSSEGVSGASNCFKTKARIPLSLYGACHASTYYQSISFPISHRSSTLTSYRCSEEPNRGFGWFHISRLDTRFKLVKYIAKSCILTFRTAFEQLFQLLLISRQLCIR